MKKEVIPLRRHGILLTCDHCGKAVLLELEKGKSGVGTVYEDPPEGWNFESGNDLCPVCSRNYGSMLKNFWKNRTKIVAHF